MDENTGTTGDETVDYAALTTGLVSAYVANNSVPAAELAALIATTYAALTGLGNAGVPAAAPAANTTPAQIRKSITHEGLISFEDGKSYKTLKRHLTVLGLTPEGYREKWGLPRDYPMVAASYSETRSALAKSAGLGQQRREAAPQTAEAAETIAEKPKSARRSRKGEGSASA